MMSTPAGNVYPVYRWSEREDLCRLVHLVDDPSDTAPALCHATTDRHGWTIWLGHVPAERWCPACLNRTL